MESPYEIAHLDALVGRIFSIEDVTVGNPQKDYIVRYRGRLRGEDSEAAYDQLAEQLKPYNITPLFRWDEDRHAILLVPGKPTPRAGNPAVNLLMFILTLISVLLMGAFYGMEGPMPSDLLGSILAVIQRGWPFTLGFLTILTAHEFGHYLMGRFHGVHLSLPYFIPLPFLNPFGTMGAFINMKEPPKNRKHLLDIGLAGPLAGLVIAIPVLIIGLSLSPLGPLPQAAGIQAGTALQLEGNSILYLLAKFLVFGKLLPAPASFGNLPEWLYWLRYFFTGRPLPFGGLDVNLHPVAWAGWGGLLITGLNLTPAGQLDGGHVMYVLFGRKIARRLLPIIIGVYAILGIFWPGWWLWVALIFFLGRVYAEPLDQITPLDPKRRALAIAALIIFILIFIPVPLNILGG
jgi:membrane-associated protease RseP (regulator of RpoE activity)